MNGSLPRVHRWLIGAAARLTPPGRREGWRREWEAEVWHALERGGTPRRVLLRTASCFIDAVWMWRRVMSMRGWSQEVMTAFRALRRRPGTAAVMVLTLGMGIGASAAVFGVLDGVVLRDLPVPDSHRLVRLRQRIPERGIDDWQYSYAQFRALDRDVTRARVAALFGRSLNVVTDVGAFHVGAAAVSDGFFDVLGVRPALGRTFTRAEEAGGARLLVLSHDFWVRALGADPAAVGRSIELDGAAYEIIGVMPRGMHVAEQMLDAYGAADARVDAYLPLEEWGARQGDFVSTLHVVGRLLPDATLAQLTQEAQRSMTAFSEARGAQGHVTVADTLKEYVVGSVRMPLLVLLGAVAVLFLLVCVNLSGLLLVGSVARAPEWAARKALGASGARIARQLLTEGAAIGALGAILGVGLAWWASAWVRRETPPGLPRATELGLHPGTVVFAVAVTLVGTLLFALVPAFFAMARPPAEVLQTARTTLSRRQRSGLRALVMSEVALATILLVCSGVLLRSMDALAAQDPGYDVRGVLRGQVQLPKDRYPTDDARRRFADAVRTRLSATPGVQAVAVASSPSPVRAPAQTVHIDGQPDPDHRTTALEHAVTPDYFGVMGVALVDGRLFTEADDADHPPVAIITRRLAEESWPGESAVGRRIASPSWRWFPDTGTATPDALREIVGVVDDLSALGLDPGDPVRAVFYPFAQEPWGFQTILARTDGDPSALAPALRAAVTEVDPDQPAFSVVPTLDDWRTAVGTERLGTGVLTAFACAALGLALLGIFGVVSYSVALRRREIGVRLAVGADAPTVTALFLRDGFLTVSAGLLAGVALASGAVRLLRGMLYEVRPLDPVAFAGAVTLLATAALVFTWIPARRTARVDAVEALKPGA